MVPTFFAGYLRYITMCERREALLTNKPDSSGDNGVMAEIVGA